MTVRIYGGDNFQNRMQELSMNFSFSCLLDVYRFVLTIERTGPENHGDLAIIEEVFLEAYQKPFADIRSHISKFRVFFSAIEDRVTPLTTHILRIDRSKVSALYRNIVMSDPGFPLIDFSNEEIEGRFKLAEIDTFLLKPLIESALDHASESFWQFVTDMCPSHARGNIVQIPFNVSGSFFEGLDFPIFRLGDLIELNYEVSDV